MANAGTKRAKRMRAVLMLLLGLSCWQAGSALWMVGKAELAQYLIATAWQRGNHSPPWPGADTRPVLRLRVAELNVDLFVLDGHHGQALAFGPGLAVPGVANSRVIAGHRDSHFRFLGAMRPGLLVSLEDAAGRSTDYQVLEVGVFDSRDQALPEFESGLLLVTCYPLSGARTGGPLRWVVRAVALRSVNHPAVPAALM